MKVQESQSLVLQKDYKSDKPLTKLVMGKQKIRYEKRST